MMQTIPMKPLCLFIALGLSICIGLVDHVAALSHGSDGKLGQGIARREAIRQSSGVFLVAAFATKPQNAVAAATGVLPDTEVGGKPHYGDEGLMKKKEHGTTSAPVQSDLLYGVPQTLADKICSFNRVFAEPATSFERTSFETVVRNANGPTVFYDSVTGKPLFVAPINRSVDEFIAESKVHGWPSFRNDETVWENVRVLKGSGEVVSVDGTHLGHDLPDKAGDRYCINLVSVAGRPAQKS